MRNAVALWAAFFLVVGAGSYAILATVEKPAASVADPAHSLSSDQQFEVNGRTYTVANVEAAINTDGELVRSGKLSWVNESAIHEEELQNNSTVTLSGEEYRILTPNRSAPATASLRAVRRPNGTADPFSMRLDEGDSISYRNNSTTVRNVSKGSVLLQWRAPRTKTVQLGETNAIKTTLVRGGLPRRMQFPAGGSNVTLNGETFTVHYATNSSVQLSKDTESYQRQLRDIRRRTERIAGLWGVVILSALTAMLLLGLSYLPTKR